MTLKQITLEIKEWRGHGGVRCNIKNCKEKAQFSIGVGVLRLPICQRHGKMYFGA